MREIEVVDRGNSVSEQYQGRDRQQRLVKDSLERISVFPLRPSSHTRSSKGKFEAASTISKKWT